MCFIERPTIEAAKGSVMAKRRRGRGHFCWCCGRHRANEGFSGRGHGQHLCKDCAKLGREELAYRQTLRNIDRLVHPYGLIQRRQRASLERFLGHPDPRVRSYVAKIIVDDATKRAALAEERLAAPEEELASGADVL